MIVGRWDGMDGGQSRLKTRPMELGLSSQTGVWDNDPAGTPPLLCNLVDDHERTERESSVATVTLVVDTVKGTGYNSEEATTVKDVPVNSGLLWEDEDGRGLCCGIWHRWHGLEM